MLQILLVVAMQTHVMTTALVLCGLGFFRPEATSALLLLQDSAKMLFGTVYTDAAIKKGASKEEIAEALGVAVAINAGAAMVYSARVMDAYAAKTSV